MKIGFINCLNQFEFWVQDRTLDRVVSVTSKSIKQDMKNEKPRYFESTKHNI